MSQPSIFRFLKNNQSEKKLSSIYRAYQILRETDGTVLATCEMEKSFLRGVTQILFPDKAPVDLRHTGTEWRIEDGARQRLGSVTPSSKPGGGWMVTSGYGHDIQFRDPASFAERVMRAPLNGFPYDYVCIEDGRESGVIQRLPRDGAGKAGAGFLGKLRRMVQTQDWVLTSENPIADTDLPLWISGVLVMIEVTAHTDRT